MTFGAVPETFSEACLLSRDHEDPRAAQALAPRAGQPSRGTAG